VFLLNFGIDAEHLPWLLAFRDWLRTEGLPNAKNDEELHAAGRPLWNFFAEQVQQRRASPDPTRSDVLSQLQRLSIDGRGLSDSEMVNIVLMTMFASLDTSNSMLGMIFHYLAGEPAAQRLAAESPERVPGMVEELIRGMPMVSTARVVTQDVERHGVTLRRGDRVLMSWGMAGLDPEFFEQPETIDLDRAHVRHLGFGIGPHRCLGMHLARRILAVAITEWHRQIPSYRLVPDAAAHWRYSPIRGLNRFELEAIQG
jgi:cytochrome P450